MSETLVLGLGNDLLADDAVGVMVAGSLEGELAGRADVVCSSLHGIALLDLMAGYKRAIVIDAVHTGRNRPGTIVEMGPEDLSPIDAPSPHFTGLPEMIELAARLRLEFPTDIRILAVEVADPYTIGGRMAAEVTAAIPELRRRVCEAVGA